MGVLTQDMRDILASAMLAFVATVRRDGSLSPKASTIPYDDDHLLFVDIASPQTIANLRNDPRIEINSVDFIRRRGYRFAGTAQVLETGHPIYEWGRAWLLKHHGPEYPTNHVVLIKLQSAEPLMSPVYTFGGRKEEEVRSTYRQIYGIDSNQGRKCCSGDRQLFVNPLATPAPAPPAASKKAATFEARNREGALVAQIKLAQKWRTR